MILTPADVTAIATEVVRLIRIAEGVSQDQSFEASLPIAEQKKRQQERVRQFKKAQKGGKQ